MGCGGVAALSQWAGSKQVLKGTRLGKCRRASEASSSSQEAGEGVKIGLVLHTEQLTATANSLSKAGRAIRRINQGRRAFSKRKPEWDARMRGCKVTQQSSGSSVDDIRVRESVRKQKEEEKEGADNLEQPRGVRAGTLKMNTARQGIAPGQTLSLRTLT
jgi:hypothetical protein